MRSRQYTMWNQEEKQRLQEVVLNNTFCGRISWEEVSKEFPQRSKQQCKSIYMNSIKDNTSQSVMDSSLNTEQWTKSQKGSLYIIARFYKLDWEMIRQNYYQLYSIQQLNKLYFAFDSDYARFRSNLFKLENWDHINTNIMSKEEAIDVYNTAKIMEYRLEKMHNSLSFNHQQIREPEIFAQETFLELERNFDFIEIQVLEEISNIHNIQTLYENALQLIRMK
ncbi:Myb-like_DNA-binding domain-containing protein [Hexamita inflata]|uniref:Myb-like DNA-binding domain-containing protein n=1 Tax=Hexamita inflata TaxID=28002 RepID=A0AA86PXL6_9EUKA|nr:Myb-like DNA-binding domain-containing protein [Hexamita inflata]CAI9947851.1 Myb-like DNA-binding domain-containing protein [Hexamita inflata]